MIANISKFGEMARIVKNNQIQKISTPKSSAQKIEYFKSKKHNFIFKTDKVGKIKT